MPAFHLTPKDFISAPWKNGKGTSLELCKDLMEPFRWRLSRSVVESGGPFSNYTGYERHLVVLKGSMVLRHGVVKFKKLGPLNLYSFSGDVPTEAEVISRVEDFNFITQCRSTTGSVFCIRMGAEEEVQLPLLADEHFVYPVQGGILIGDPNEDREYRLMEGDLLRLSRQTPKELLNLRLLPELGTTLLWVVLRYK